MDYFKENHIEVLKYTIYDSINNPDGVIFVLKNKQYTDLKKIYTYLIDENHSVEYKYKQMKKLYSQIECVKYFNCLDCLNKCCSNCFFTHYSWDVDRNIKSFINIDKYFHNLPWLMWLHNTWLKLYMCEKINKPNIEEKKIFIDVITYNLFIIIQ
jgi:hypothetical protein|tara:strand:+ start:111 stop:575 length:465 start_codon:yes stop_codon:yes gene_type:complete